MVEFRGDSSRVASIAIKINTKYYLQVVQVYASTSTHEDEEVEEFYEEVSKIVRENRSYYKIMIGDFSAKVGGYQQGDGAAVGQYRYGERNQSIKQTSIGPISPAKPGSERDNISSICNI